MEKIGSLLAEIADSRNPIVREQVARYRDSLVQNLVNEDLRDLAARVSAREFDAADELFRKLTDQTLAELATDAPQERYLKGYFNIMVPLYTRSGQVDRARQHIAQATRAVQKDIDQEQARDVRHLVPYLESLNVLCDLSDQKQVDKEQLRRIFDSLKSELAEKPAAALTIADFAAIAQLASSLQETEYVNVAVAAYQFLAATAEQSGRSNLASLGAPYTSIVERLTLLGKELEITGSMVDGSPFDWESLRGKVVLIDFWTSWCPPCWPEIDNAQKGIRTVPRSWL